jgi:uncharacterized RDD family membrane protein YckC
MDIPLTGQRCPRCGSAIPKDAPLGACPACLLAAVAQPASELTEGLSDVTDAVSSGAYANEPARFSPGDLFGAYRIVALVGRGGMGEVYEAIADDGRRVALKLLRERLAGRVDRDRFLREGVLAASVTHPNCVYVYGSDEIGGVPVISMELAAGGTLKLAIEQFGPRTPVQAVREILQVIAGLEAAADAGILHRDVKPSNCFIDADDGVKIGDFGLSMSLNASDGDIAWRPTFQGTPEFAAPEQLRGERLDVRADIYGVGATLFFLLTGYSPFGERNIAKLIALKTRKPAPDAAAYLPDIPTGLTLLVGRCMSPDPDRRPQTYADLRAQLLPFISEAPSPASMPRRFAAMFIDSSVSNLTVPLLAAVRALNIGGADRVVSLLLSFAYFSLCERLFGGTPGKLVLGIQVVGVNRHRPTLAACAARWVIVFGLQSALFVALAFGVLEPIDTVYQILSLAIPVFALCSALYAQTRPDRAMFHDAWTATRVVRAQPSPVAAAEPPNDLELTRSMVTTPVSVERVGPFDVIGKVSDTPEGDVLLARDPQLRRFVWIHRRRNAPGALSAARRQLAQPTRLRWLAGNDTWDAFEVPDGVAFRSAARRPDDWRRLTQWLADLSRDLEGAETAGVLPVLAIDRLWLLSNGQAMILDFRAPGAEGEPDQPDASVPAFLARLAAAPGARRIPRNLRLVQDALAGAWITTRAAAAILQKLSHGPLELSRRRRALPILVCALPAIVFAAGSWLQESAERARFEGPDAALRLVLDQMIPRDVLSGTNETRKLLRMFVAESFHAELSAGQAFWNSPRGREFIRYRAAIEDSARWFTPETPDQARAAREAADEYLRIERQQNRRGFRPDARGRFEILGSWMMQVLVPVALLSFMIAFIASPFLFRATGQALEDAEGLDAPVGRRVARAFITWCPLLLLPVHPWLPVALLAVGAGYAVAFPERAIQDRVAGTFVAPR